MDVNFKFNSPEARDKVYFEQIFAEKPGGGLVVNPSVDLPPTTPVGFNSNGKLEAFKCYRLYEAVEAADTTIKIVKGSGVASGDIIGHGETAVACTAVDTTNEDYDAVTVTLGEDIAADTVLYEAKAESAAAAGNDPAVLGEPKLKPVFVLGAPIFAGKGDQLVKLVNGANLRKETANISQEVADLLPGITLI